MKKTKLYPHWIAKIISWFIPQRKNRHHFLMKHDRKNRQNLPSLFNGRVLKDVLFVWGGPGACYRYRVLHQMQQLNAMNFSSFEIYYTDLVPQCVKDYRIIIFYRCPYTDSIGEAIKFAKIQHKAVLFDIDDLVIDAKYTSILPYVKTMNMKERELYDSGVFRHRKTLMLCEGCITTTGRLAKELRNYVPDVFINRNVASEEIFSLSMDAIKLKKNRTNKEIKIGYFSGTKTHDGDLALVSSSIKKILEEFENVKFVFVGEIELPKNLENYSSRIEHLGLVFWKKLPSSIADVDINIAPLEENIFNEAKSENKWVEAALVKVPTIASNFGAFKESIKNGENGLLCSTAEEWYEALKLLILNSDYRKKIADQAYRYCKKNYNTISSGFPLTQYLNKKARKHIGFILPSLQICGGIRVALTHASFLQDMGYDVELITPENLSEQYEFCGHKFNTINRTEDRMEIQFDILVGTLWSTLPETLIPYQKAKRKLYLVQNYETDFYNYQNINRVFAERTYVLEDVEYITISKWCADWLQHKYKREKVKYAPNGITLSNYKSHKRNLKEKVKILIEGDCWCDYKNVDESFKIVEKLDKDKVEIGYMSYNGTPKKNYRVDQFFHKIPYEEVGKIYEQYDILIKSSYLESFSYPPLEMMATGGYCVVVPNDGNVEYLKDRENCLFYRLGNVDDAVLKIKELLQDTSLQNTLYTNGLATAEARDWSKIKEDVLKLYE